MITKDLITEASIELSLMDRYLSHLPSEEAFSTDNLWELINEMSKCLESNDNSV